MKLTGRLEGALAFGEGTLEEAWVVLLSQRPPLHGVCSLGEGSSALSKDSP